MILDAEDERAVRLLRWVIGLLLAAGVVAFVTRGGGEPADPVVAGQQPLRTVSFQGADFSEVAIRVTGPEAPETERCALLAETVAQRSRGLMEATSLQGYAGMVFRFDTDVQSQFYMFNTPLPLSIAWFDAEGAFVSATDMEPCGGDDPSACPLYGAAGPYRYALEVPKGGLRAMGVGPGSRLELGGRCPGR